MSDLFSIYEDNLNIVLKNITQIISSMKNLSKEKTENALDEANSNLKEADRIIKQMQIEIKNDPLNSSNNLLSIKENYIQNKSQSALLIEGSYKKSGKGKSLIDSENEEDFKYGQGQSLEMVNMDSNQSSELFKNDMYNEGMGTREDDIRDELFDINRYNNKWMNELFVKKNKVYILFTVLAIIITIILIVFVYSLLS